MMRFLEPLSLFRNNLLKIEVCVTSLIDLKLFMNSLITFFVTIPYNSKTKSILDKHLFYDSKYEFLKIKL